jgi:hypothetical protein
MKLNGFEVPGQGVASRREGARWFTPEQANAALPLIRRIVQDIVGTYQSVLEQHARLHTLPESVGSEEAGRLVRARDQGVARLGCLQEELEAIGCELKDPECGLVDFPARRRGRPVCLCWKLGEERVAYWHELNAGLVGRRPVDQH